MSTLAPAAPVTSRRPAPTSRLSFGGLVRAEWIALTSLRATHWALWIGAALAFGLTAGMALLWASDAAGVGDPLALERIPPVSNIIVNGYIVAIAVAVVLGAAAYAKEHATGSLRTRLAAAPRRGQSLLAMAVVTGATLFVFSVVGFALCFAACALIYGAFGAPVTLTDPMLDLVLPLLGIGVGTALTAAFSLGVAAMLRSETWAVSLTFVFILVIPTVLFTLPWEWAATASEYVFGTTVQALPGTSAGLTGEYLTDLALTIGWATAAMVGGSIVMNRRDA